MFTQRGKTGDDEGETKDYKKKLKKRLTTSHAINVQKDVTMRETVNAPHRQISNRMQKY